jgi:hypothetical protein
MRDYLNDIVAHTLPLGVVNMLKVTGTDTTTQLDSVDEKRNVVIKARFNEPNAAFVGTFGFPNLAKLASILSIPEYKENASIYVIYEDRDGTQAPRSLQFKNANADFQNNYRFMTEQVVNDKLEEVKFKGVNWDVTFEPTVQNIQRLKYQASANSEHDNFKVKTVNNELKFYFGDASTHAGDFTFQGGVSGNIRNEWQYPVALFQSVVNLQGDKEVSLSDQGVIQVIVNSGLITYEYLLPANTK